MDKRRLGQAVRAFVQKVLEGDAPTLYAYWRRLTMPVLVVCSVVIFADMSLHGRILAAVILLAVIWGAEWLSYKYVLFWWNVRQRWRRRWDPES